MDFWDILIKIIHSVVLVLGITTGFAYVTFFERRLLARFQARVGPNRAGWDGWMQPAADAIKLMFKEDIMPAEADKVIYFLAPALAAAPAIFLFAVIPIGKAFTIGDRTISLAVADINIGLLFILAVTSIAVYGITLGGWSSNNKYSMLGGVRASAQMISYELALAFALIVPVMLSAWRLPEEVGTLSLSRLVDAQTGWWFAFTPTGFVAFIVFIIAATAETTRAPFDLVEAEQELVGGFNTEYSSMKFALFFMAEYIKLIAISALGVTLFLGGWRFPFLADIEGILGSIISVVVFVVKVGFFLFLSIWVRATLPRFRYDQLMNIGWKRLLPISIAAMVLTAVWGLFVPKF
jgi:NADH-quinone oxidoreductase subunit H